VTVRDATAEFTAHRGRMFGLAYRMLGSAMDAEDVVQDAFLRWSGADHAGIAAPGAWLARTTTNLCLDLLTSARVRRERYVGPWLPEPVLTEDGVLGPHDQAQQRDSVSLAMLALLERLTPTERAVFVLREAFGYDHASIADILGCSTANSRQLHSRARRRLEQDQDAPHPRKPADTADVRRLVERFLAAAREGDLAELESMLTADVVSWSDGGGQISAARHPIVGAPKVGRLFMGLARKAGPDARADVREINGEPALIVTVPDQTVPAQAMPDGTTMPEQIVVIALEINGGRIRGVRAVVNPGKLRYLRHQLSHSQPLSSPS
jgi:RNA polymerase sigma-70 factor (TIGR02957 family)